MKTKFKETEIGKIPEEWVVKELRELANFQYGLGEPAQHSGSLVYIRITDITSDGFLDKKAMAFIDKEKVKQVDYLEKGDVLIARTGASFGKSYFFNENFKATFGGFLIKLSLDKKQMTSEFFFHFSRSKQYWNQANNLVTGGAQPQFNANVLSKLIVPVPSLSEQQAIAKILSDLDSKIELNHQMNQTLEATAQALFKHWFVDFEFPNEKGKPYKSSGGKMVWSEELQKEMPEGWRAGKFEEIADVGTGKRPNKRSDFKTNEFSIELLGASEVMGYVHETLYSKPILVIGRVGTHGIVQRITKDSWPSDNTLVISSRYYEYSYQILKTIDYASLNVGSTQPLITQTQIKNEVTLIPKESVLEDFERLVSKLYTMANSNNTESECLSSIRDSLLPKLMSGQIRVGAS